MDEVTFTPYPSSCCALVKCESCGSVVGNTDRDRELHVTHHAALLLMARAGRAGS